VDEEREDPSTRAALAAVRRVAVGLVWRCEVCGYQRWSISRPPECPACHAPGETFVGLSAADRRA